jgi:hypothetical protein
MIIARVEEFQPVRDVLTQQAGHINRVGQRQQAADRILQGVSLRSGCVVNLGARLLTQPLADLQCGDHF